MSLCVCFSYIQVLSGQKHHFSKLIEELQLSETDEYAACILAFINCLIASSSGLEARVHLRNELLGIMHSLVYIYILHLTIYLPKNTNYNSVDLV